MNVKQFLGEFIFRLFSMFFRPFGFELRKRPSHWLPNLDSLISKLLGGSADLALDIGANRGQSLQRIHGLFGDSVQIHCFEPIASAFNQLEKNAVGHNVRLNKVALSSSEGVATIQAPVGRDDLSSLIGINLKSTWSKSRVISDVRIREEEIRTTTLDNYCKEFKARIDFLKIDTQGFEKSVLAGAKKLLKDKNRRPRVIQLEVNLGNSYDESTDISDIDRPLVEAGYKLIFSSSPINLWNLPSTQVDVLYVDEEIFSQMPS